MVVQSESGSKARLWAALGIVLLSLLWGYTWVIAIICSRAILNEAFSRYEIAGILLIGSGLLLLSFVSWLLEQRRNLSGT